MDNRIEKNGEFLGNDSSEWACIMLGPVAFLFPGGLLCWSLWIHGYEGGTKLLVAAWLIWVLIIMGCWITAAVRGRREDQRSREQNELVRLSSLPLPPVDQYQQTAAELQARKENALKMQRLHELRKQVEEEERKAGIFAPTLSPAPGTQTVSAAADSSLPTSRAVSSNPVPSRITPAQSAAMPDNLSEKMNVLARRQQEAERQKHYQKSLRQVEESEREADGL